MPPAPPSLSPDQRYGKDRQALSGLGFTPTEIDALFELCEKQDLLSFQVLRQALRTYQLVAVGRAVLTDVPGGPTKVTSDAIKPVDENAEPVRTSAGVPEPGWRIARHDSNDYLDVRCKHQLRDGSWAVRDYGCGKPFMPGSCYSVPIAAAAAASPIPDVETAVCADIMERQKQSVPNYGHTLANNPQDLRSWLVELYQEMLDSVNYTKRAIFEIDARLADEDPQQAEINELKRQIRELRAARDRALDALSLEDAEAVIYPDPRDE